jgi:hypothetical protein
MESNGSEDEFYDALNNTQALNEIREQELINSPTLKLVDRLYNQSSSTNNKPGNYDGQGMLQLHKPLFSSDSEEPSRKPIQL